MTEEIGRIQRRNRLTLIGLFALFALPIMVAYSMIYSGKGWNQNVTVNRGTLVHPVRALSLPPLRQADGNAFSLDAIKGAWALLYIGDRDCGERCATALAGMRQARLALGRDMDEVGRLYIQAGPATSLDPAWLEAYAGMQVAFLTGQDEEQLIETFGQSRSEVLAAGRTYMIDPLGYLMMYYEAPLNASDVLKDMQRLMKTTRGQRG